ncbi:MAG: hypothetical protein K6T73_07525 [Candidatus Bathyarchaeota archaeon]|nr:hypothetical protein [Candidatus Bathyarchaeota archaeon]
MNALDTVGSYISKISVVIGIIFLILGVTLIKPFTFSIEASTFMLLGGALLAIAFITHFKIYKNSTRPEKIFATCGALAIFLIVLAIVVYTIVEVKTETVQISVRISRIQARDALVAKLVPVPIYSSISLILAAAGLALLFYSLYIKTKYL